MTQLVVWPRCIVLHTLCRPGKLPQDHRDAHEEESFGDSNQCVETILDSKPLECLSTDDGSDKAADTEGKVEHAKTDWMSVGSVDVNPWVTWQRT